MKTKNIINKYIIIICALVLFLYSLYYIEEIPLNIYNNDNISYIIDNLLSFLLLNLVLYLCIINLWFKQMKIANMLLVVILFLFIAPTYSYLYTKILKIFLIIILIIYLLKQKSNLMYIENNKYYFLNGIFFIISMFIILSINYYNSKLFYEKEKYECLTIKEKNWTNFYYCIKKYNNDEYVHKMEQSYSNLIK